MNNLTALQRKLIYLVAIGCLLIPISILGRPSTNESGSGGTMAKMRYEQNWGEDNLGDVDPSSATMNLVLLGLRGVATNMLWVDAKNQSEKKQWGELKNTVDSIALLQPHYENVWQFQGWNLAYNVSAEWDGVEDRYYWVKEGGKYMMKGSKRNANSPALMWHLGDRIYRNKIGRSDEWRIFRQFFKSDPDTKRYQDGIDSEFDPDALGDNYLVAKEWFRKANNKQKEYPDANHVKALYSFRQDRALAQINYAAVMHREGKFSEDSRKAWEEALENWTDKFREDDALGYGREEFSLAGNIKVYQEVKQEDLEYLAIKNDTSIETIKGSVNFLQSTTNYRYWRDLARAEKDLNTLQAHQEIWRGQQLYKQAKNEEAAKLLYSGMQKLEKTLLKYSSLKAGIKKTDAAEANKPEFLKNLSVDDLVIEEVILAQIYWREALYFSGEAEPGEKDQYPLKAIWEDKNNADLITKQRKKLELEEEMLFKAEKK